MLRCGGIHQHDLHADAFAVTRHFVVFGSYR